MNKKSKCVIVVFLIVILVITKCVILNETMQMDVVFYDFLKKFIMNDYVTKFMKFITWFGRRWDYVMHMGKRFGKESLEAYAWRPLESD